jgi:protein TonB
LQWAVCYKQRKQAICKLPLPTVDRPLPTAFMESINNHILLLNTAPVLILFFHFKTKIMNSNTILKADILDIVFEKRNKLYGAYSLRKFYPNRLKLALGFMFIIAIFFSAFTLLPEKHNRVITKPVDISTELAKVKDKPKDPEKKQEVVKTEKQPVAKATPQNQKQFLSSLKIVDDKLKTDSIPPLLPTDVISSKTVVTTTPGIPYVDPPKTEPGNGGPEKTEPKIDKTLPMDGDAVDVMPAYPGGMEALRKFLEKNLQTPTEMENGETVSVRVKFVVDYAGKLKSFVTVLDGGEAYNKEVVRVLKKMPDWVPGKTRGENVSVYYVIPVKFTNTD